jgi:uncharacterized protein YigA (DUF484 family)
MNETMSIDATAVADYLKQNPGFFEDYADVVAQIFVPHPHGGHAIPIAERQMLALRDKVYGLEEQMRELVAHGNANERIGDKLHRSTLALIAAGDLETTLAVLAHTLREDFDVPDVAIRLWPARDAEPSSSELAPIAAEMRDYIEHLRAPYCGVEAPPAASAWFEGDAERKSFAFLPLRTERTFGVLALASGDAQRFHDEMGTMYLLRLAELASVAISRYFTK